jgi:hypothetical protein
MAKISKRRRNRKRDKAPGNTTVRAGGPPCPRCGEVTQIREHKAIRAKELARPFYYSRWYYCANPRCRTTTIMPPEFIVVPEGSAREAQDVVARVMRERTREEALAECRAYDGPPPWE